MCITVPVTNISRGSLHDGPGVRTVIYFKGCTLHCRWCHNPETISTKRQILQVKSKCIHCGKCVETCPEHYKISGNDIKYIREGCLVCGKCAEACPALALTLCPETMSVDKLFSEIKKDIHYYKTSNGGVTFSGGECGLSAEFVAEIAQKCKSEGIHTAVESAFHVPWQSVEKVLPFIDLFFADFKIPDSEKHKEFTGQGNSLILENIRKISVVHNNIILRIPVIPGVNDSQDDIDLFAETIKTFSGGVKEIEL